MRAAASGESDKGAAAGIETRKYETNRYATAQMLSFPTPMKSHGGKRLAFPTPTERHGGKGSTSLTPMERHGGKGSSSPTSTERHRKTGSLSQMLMET